VLGERAELGHLADRSPVGVGEAVLRSGCLPFISQAISSHRCSRPLRQNQHPPHEGIVESTTWSPSLTWVRFAPTPSTTPAAS
jgi:hypothetical protein